MHHATTGNLDRRGTGDVTLLTLAEYRALPLLRRLGYRLYRHPLVMFGVGPAWLFCGACAFRAAIRGTGGATG